MYLYTFECIETQLHIFYLIILISAYLRGQTSVTALPAEKSYGCGLWK